MIAPDENKKSEMYEFEYVINSVLEMSIKHFEMLRSFYYQKFEGSIIIILTHFLKSNFSFKFFENEIKPIGMFHSSRVVF